MDALESLERACLDLRTPQVRVRQVGAVELGADKVSFGQVGADQ